MKLANKLLHVLFIFCSFLLLSGCAGAKSATHTTEKTQIKQAHVSNEATKTPTTKSKSASTRKVEKGLATYYGDGFNNRKTASGERFHNSKMVAAHKTLPFGTYVKVTALWNGKTTVVRITDRGPFKKGRIIDLSKSAASQLNLIRKGVGPVEIEVINKP